MPNPSTSPIPEFREWSIAAVRLLQGVIYADEDRVWNILLSNRSQIETFVARLGLTLVVDEAEGYAYVRQWGEDECPSGYEQLPKLVRRSQLGYPLMCWPVTFLATTESVRYRSPSNSNPSSSASTITRIVRPL